MSIIYRIKPIVEVLWDAITESNQAKHTTIEVLQETKWNTDFEDKWIIW